MALTKKTQSVHIFTITSTHDIKAPGGNRYAILSSDEKKYAVPIAVAVGIKLKIPMQTFLEEFGLSKYMKTEQGPQMKKNVITIVNRACKPCPSVVLKTINQFSPIRQYSINTGNQ